MNRKNKPEYIVADVTEEEYRNDLAQGLEPDEVLMPGRHKFRRGGFMKRHGLVSAKVPAPMKVIISVGADTDMPNCPVQCDSSSVLSCAETLLSDQHFIEAVAMRVKNLKFHSIR